MNPLLHTSKFRRFFFSSRRRHTRWTGDWSSDVCSSDLPGRGTGGAAGQAVDDAVVVQPHGLIVDAAGLSELRHHAGGEVEDRQPPAAGGQIAMLLEGDAFAVRRQG